MVSNSEWDLALGETLDAAADDLAARCAAELGREPTVDEYRAWLVRWFRE